MRVNRSRRRRRWGGVPVAAWLERAREGRSGHAKEVKRARARRPRPRPGTRVKREAGSGKRGTRVQLARVPRSRDSATVGEGAMSRDSGEVGEGATPRSRDSATRGQYTGMCGAVRRGSAGRDEHSRCSIAEVRRVTWGGRGISWRSARVSKVRNWYRAGVSGFPVATAHPLQNRRVRAATPALARPFGRRAASPVDAVEPWIAWH